MQLYHDDGALLPGEHTHRPARPHNGIKTELLLSTQMTLSLPSTDVLMVNAIQLLLNT